MKRWMLAVVAAVAVGLVGASGAEAAKAEHKGKKAAAGTAGVLQKIEGSGSTLKLTVASGHGKRARTATVATDAKTKVTVDGQVKHLSDLKVGEHVKLSAARGTIAAVDARTPAPAKGQKKAARAKKAA